jgi:hypothetical protein
MTSPSEPEWVLMIPFITAPDFPLKESRTVTLCGLHAEVRPAEFDYTIITIDGIRSAQAAFDLFESMRIGTLIASLNINWGIRLLPNVRILESDSPMPNEPDRPLIYPKGRNLRRLVGPVGVIQMNPDKVLPKLLESLEIGLKLASARKAMTDNLVKLAIELYVDTYFETSDSARFIGFVGVLVRQPPFRP